MVCANPDLIVGLPGGKVGNMPGKIAERYVQKGGKTIRYINLGNLIQDISMHVLIIWIYLLIQLNLYQALHM